jgi:hypothetical protein
VAQDGPVLCPFRRITGRPCPSCGLTRSWQATAHLRPGEGIRSHPLGPASLIGALWLAVDDGAEARIRRADPRHRMALTGAWVAVWVWRLYRGETAPVGTERAAGLRP